LKFRYSRRTVSGAEIRAGCALSTCCAYGPLI